MQWETPGRWKTHLIESKFIQSILFYSFVFTLTFLLTSPYLSDHRLPSVFFEISLVCPISVESAVHVIQETEGTWRLSVLQRLLTAAGTFASSAEENLMQGKLPMVPFSVLVSEGWQDEIDGIWGKSLNLRVLLYLEWFQGECIPSVPGSSQLVSG